MAEAGEVGPLWVLARRQSAGRGRRGRSWSSEPGNLAATLLMTTTKAPAEAAQVTFVAALAVADLLDAFVPADLVSIKWPNDVLLDGAKAAGILVESGPRADGGLWLAIGVGVNLVRHPADTERPATAVADHLRGDVAVAPGAEAAAGELAARFADWAERWTTLGFSPVLDAWSARAGGLHGPCMARLGRETLAGTADGVEPDGALRLRLPSGELRRVSAGDVFFGETA